MFAVLAVLVSLAYSFVCISLGAFLCRALKAARHSAGQEGVGSLFPPLARAHWESSPEKGSRPLEFRMASASSAGRIGTCFLLGQGVLAAVWVPVALAGWFTVELIVPLSVACLLLGARAGGRELLIFALELAGELWRLRREPLMFGLFALATAAASLLWAVDSLVRPISGEGDAAAFYMAYAKFIALGGKLLPLPGYEPISDIGMQGELHMAVLMAFGLGSAAKFFSFIVCAAGACMLVEIARDCGVGRRGRWVAVGCLTSSSVVTLFLSDGKVDLYGLSMGLAALSWAMKTAGPSERPALRLTGVLTSLAVVAKISLAVPLPAAVAVIVVLRSRSMLASLRPAPAALLVIGCWSLLAAAPHVLKNTVLFGEPLAPFIVFDRMKWLQQAWIPPAAVPRLLLTYPLQMFFGRYPMQLGHLSPLVLALFPLVLLLPRPRSWLRSPLVQVTLAGVVGVAAWTAVRPAVCAPRYILPVLALMILPAAAAAGHVLRRRSGRGLLRSGLYPALLLMQAWVVHHHFAAFLPAHAKHYALHGPFEAEHPATTACYIVNRQAKPGERVYLLQFYRYQLRPDLLLGLQTLDDLEEIYASEEIPERWRRLYEAGFRYLIYHPPMYQTLGDDFGIDVTRTDVPHTPDWLDVRMIHANGPYFIYHLRRKEPAVEKGVRPLLPDADFLSER